jgi:hypothetical protein
MRRAHDQLRRLRVGRVQRLLGIEVAQQLTPRAHALPPHAPARADALDDPRRVKEPVAGRAQHGRERGTGQEDPAGDYEEDDHDPDPDALHEGLA